MPIVAYMFLEGNWYSSRMEAGRFPEMGRRHTDGAHKQEDHGVRLGEFLHVAYTKPLISEKATNVASSRRVVEPSDE